LNIISVRGATTIEENKKENILERTEELLNTILDENKIEIKDIKSIIFTATEDITKVYPAVAARNIGITKAALMCVQEMHVEGSLPMCIRIMMDFQRRDKDPKLPIKHIYLHKASKLRPDLAESLAIAIDGPAGAGKSTIAKEVASQLGYVYIDTGAMYRAVAYYCKENSIDWKREEEVIGALKDIKIEIQIINEKQHIYLNKKDITDSIRNEEIASGASTVATYEKVRIELVRLQQELASKTSVVMDGRDIGTHVLPNANYKIFLTASVTERAMRRVQELEQNGQQVELKKIKEDIIKRDYNDSNRKFSPLSKAEDAIIVDTTGKSIKEVTDEVLNIIK